VLLLARFCIAADAAGHRASVDLALPEAAARLLGSGENLPIDLPTALRLAASSNLEILEARARASEAAGEKSKALAGFLPTLSTFFAASKVDGRIQGSFGDLENHTFSTLEPGGAISATIDPGLALFDTLAAYKRLAASAEREEAVTQQTLLAATERFLELEEALARVAIAEQAVATSQELLRLARDREELGRGLRVSVELARARLASDEALVVEARRRFRDASVALALVLQLDPTVTLFPPPLVEERAWVEPASAPDLVRQAVASRPEVEESRQLAEAAEDSRTALWWKALGPKLAGTVQESAIGRSFGNLDNQQFYGGFVGWTFSPATIGEIQAAGARVELADIQRTRVRQAVASDVVRASDALVAARERLAAVFPGLEAAQASLELSRSRYADGVGLELEVLEAQQALTDARTALVGAITETNRAQAALLRATGDISLSALTAAP
jgi:outer membrane protein TolC